MTEVGSKGSLLMANVSYLLPIFIVVKLTKLLVE